MEKFESEAVATSFIKPIVWHIYVDNVFIIWDHNDENIQAFLCQLNQIHSAIKFKIEMEKEGT